MSRLDHDMVLPLRGGSAPLPPSPARGVGLPTAGAARAPRPVPLSALPRAPRGDPQRGWWIGGGSNGSGDEETRRDLSGSGLMERSHSTDAMGPALLEAFSAGQSSGDNYRGPRPPGGGWLAGHRSRSPAASKPPQTRRALPPGGL